jgi:hypothetical protein
MMTPDAIPGSAPVARLTAMPAWEAELVLTLRVWMEGPEGQAEVRAVFADCLGEEGGLTAFYQLEDLLCGMTARARRPLARHSRGCACVGSDEAVLVCLVREAVQGDLAEAALIASLLVPASAAEMVALRAAQVGQAMQRISDRAPRLVAPEPVVSRRLH